MQLVFLAFAVLLLAANAENKRNLIEISRKNLTNITNIIQVERDNLESVFLDRVLLWTTTSDLKKLDRAGVPHRPAVDVSLKNCKKTHQNNHTRVAVSDAPDWKIYCGYECVVHTFNELKDRGCGTIESIGKSVEGRDILAFSVGTQGPPVLMAGGIHGDEPVGGQQLIRWLYETCTNPDEQQKEIRDTVRVTYLPMLNPDGYVHCTRTNANKVDLNRAFPTPTGGAGNLQPEVTAYINFCKDKKFTISLMYHGGAICVNYALDSCYKGVGVPEPCPPANPPSHFAKGKDVYPSAKVYADHMKQKYRSCTVGGASCMTNGASWYEIQGSSQDWAFWFNGQVDMTMEISAIKWPESTTLPEFWDDNKDAMYNFMRWPVKKRA